MNTNYVHINKYVIVNNKSEIVKSNMRFGDGKLLSENCLNDIYYDYSLLESEYEK